MKCSNSNIHQEILRALSLSILLITTMSASQALCATQQQMSVVDVSKKLVQMPPWPAGDERGMANTMGPGTWARCGYHLSNSKSQVYEVSHIRSNSMPMSPFGKPLSYKFTPTVTLPGTKHAFNGEQVEGGEPGAQGTQMDALGHFAYRNEVWDGKSENPANSAKYYSGFKQNDVKPDADSPLLKLGIEKVPPSLLLQSCSMPRLIWEMAKPLNQAN